MIYTYEQHKKVLDGWASEEVDQLAKELGLEIPETATLDTKRIICAKYLALHDRAVYAKSCPKHYPATPKPTERETTKKRRRLSDRKNIC